MDLLASFSMILFPNVTNNHNMLIYLSPFRQAAIQKESEAVTRRRQELETAEALIDQDREARRDREKLQIEKERKRVEAARSDQAEAARSKSDRERRNVVNVVNNNSVSVDSEI